MKAEGLEVAEKTTLGTAIAATVMLTCAAFAGANDYAFEPVAADIKKGEEVTVAVRLVHKPTGKAVPDAVIFASRIDMSPESLPRWPPHLGRSRAVKRELMASKPVLPWQDNGF